MSRRKKIVLATLAVLPLGLLVITAWGLYEAWQQRERGLRW